MFFYFQVLENFVPPLFDAVLFDYQRNVPAAREPEVLSLLATFVNRLEVRFFEYDEGRGSLVEEMFFLSIRCVVLNYNFSFRAASAAKFRASSTRYSRARWR